MQEVSHVRAVLWIDVGYRSSDFQTNIANRGKHHQLPETSRTVGTHSAKGLHSLKLTFSPLKMVVSNRNLLFQGAPIFRGELLVSGRVCNM